MTLARICPTGGRARSYWFVSAVVAAALAACSGGDSGSRDAARDASEAGMTSDADLRPVCDSVEQTRCGAGAGACVDLQTDPSNCGACGNACPAGAGATAACRSGVCLLVCGEGRADCNATSGDSCEADLATSTTHCGACGISCPEVEHGAPRCDMATCVANCTEGFGDCDMFFESGCESDLRADLDNCGACAMACPWPARSTLSCTDSTCGFACRRNYDNCDRAAANGCEVALVSAANCGMCGRPCNAATRYCAETEAGITCVSTCPSDTTDCDFACIHTESNPDHCGACNNRCPDAPNAQAACVASRCALECRPGYADCDGDPANGCEVNLATSAAHCGACGNTCVGGLNGDAFCSAGVCRLRCRAGTQDCDRNGATGCEVSPASDPRNCGGCGRACPDPMNGAATCAAGTCGFTCEPGFANCDGLANTGCETSVTNNPAHCGACGRACPANTACVGTECRASSCPRNRGECDGNASTACETDLLTAQAHCGACGAACTRANARSSCLGGGCVLNACNAGFGNCDGRAANGCETDLTSATNCGACGTRCAFANAQALCTTGACALGACNANFGDCDANARNGCETNTLSSTRHCGACGRACAAGQTCVMGACQGGAVLDGGVEAGTPDAMDAAIDATDVVDVTAPPDAPDVTAPPMEAGMDAGPSCPTGTIPCGTSMSCTNTAVDPANCGTCGNACATGQSCVAGACACPAGRTLCGGTCVNLQADPMHCGACGMVCDGGRSCAAGMCRCPTGQTFCGGACVNTLTDRTNCGSCGVACPAGQLCSAGVCGLTCGTGLTVCGSGSSMACADLRTDAMNCGACGTTCTARPGASAVACTASTCTLTCAAGRGNCDNMFATGCEVNTQTSTMHCGACGTACPATLPGASAVTCAAGACAPTCAAGRGNCDMNSANGCEVIFASNAMHCGACGVACTGGRVCTMGACACPAGQTLCAGSCVNTQTSMANCGGCGVTCPASPANAGAGVCATGACSFTCNTGFGNCDATATNGCETNTTNSAANCGACGNACNTSRPNASGATCVTSACRPTCNMGFGNCDGVESNGCETTLATSAMHCGMCGLACAAGLSCVAGTCVADPDPPRQLRPLSTSVVTTRRPTLGTTLPTGVPGVRFEIYRDRACTMSVANIDVAAGASARPTADLADGTYFWRTRGRTSGGAAGARTSAVWQFYVRGNSRATDTTQGVVTDFTGDGRADAAWASYGGPNGIYYVVATAGAGLNLTAWRMLAVPGATASVGGSIAAAGDFDGDGIGDLVVGDDRFGAGSPGRVTILYGSATAGAELTAMQHIVGTGTINFGASVEAAGDVNGDGYGDIVVGAPGSNGGNGSAIAYLGGPRGSTPSPTGGAGSGSVSATGFSVAGAGDFNGDGYTDIAFGGPTLSGSRGYIGMQLGSPTGLMGYRQISGNTAGMELGYAVRFVGDINGDGYGDLAFSAPGLDGAGGQVDVGEVRVALGNAAGTFSVANTAALGLAAPIANLRMGTSIALIGQLQSNTTSDVLVGTNLGNVRVYRGATTITSGTTVAPGTGPNDGFATGPTLVGAAGDYNGDGIPDVLIGISATRFQMHLGTAMGINPSPTSGLIRPAGDAGRFPSDLAERWTPPPALRPRTWAARDESSVVRF